MIDPDRTYSFALYTSNTHYDPRAKATPFVFIPVSIAYERTNPLRPDPTYGFGPEVHMHGATAEAVLEAYVATARATERAMRKIWGKGQYTPRPVVDVYWTDGTLWRYQMTGKRRVMNWRGNAQ